MFGFLRRKKPPAPAPVPEPPAAPPVEPSAPSTNLVDPASAPATVDPAQPPATIDVGPAPAPSSDPVGIAPPSVPSSASVDVAPTPARVDFAPPPAGVAAQSPAPETVVPAPPPAAPPARRPSLLHPGLFRSAPPQPPAPPPSAATPSAAPSVAAPPVAAPPVAAPPVAAPPVTAPPVAAPPIAPPITAPVSAPPVAPPIAGQGSVPPVAAPVSAHLVAPQPAAESTAEASAQDTEPGEAAPDGYELAPAPAERKGWMARLKQGLGKTRGNLAGLFGLTKIDETLFEDLETALLTSDAGFEATERLLKDLRARVKSQRLTTGEQVREALRALIAEALRPLEQPMDIDEARPLVMMIAGVNGAGKTTSIGKLTHHLQREGKSILLAAGDTFRAAAREQLATWGARNDVQVIAQQGGDPAAVAFDAVSAGVARSTGVVMIDTAGRLPTQTHLMDELKKIKRVLSKAMAGAPHQTLLILDGNTGQNMLTQVKAFDETVGLTGLIVTKLDGTAKGGALIGLAWQQRDKPIPVYFIGVGEGIDDLQAFSAAEFAEAVTGA